jgi:glutamate-5-semialdehyde dehydrogenase
MSTLQQQMETIGRAARDAYSALAMASAQQKSLALTEAAAAIRASEKEILAANAADMEAARSKGIAPAMLDRLQLDGKRIQSMAAGVQQMAALPDPVGRVLDAWDVESNGLHIEKIAVPLGVIGIIYEARPNVTADAAALCIKSGNAANLRGGSESIHSSRAIVAAVHAGLKKAGLPLDAVQLVPVTDREAVGIMLGMVGLIDIIVPRGGKSLTERVMKESRIPTIQHLEGNCHVYVHASADAAVAKEVVHNAKLRRTGICGSAESLLIDAAFDGSAIVKDLLDSGCEVRGDAAVQKIDARVKAATEEDWGTEYLAPIIAAKAVGGLGEAIAHINRYGSHHTDAIIATDKIAAQQFTRQVDSAIVLVNASTHFADGGEFGFGGEIGISTGRLHARGPVGAAQLTTYKYIVTTAKPGAVRAG